MKHNLGLAENIASILIGFGKLSMKKSIHRGHTHSARYRKCQLGMALLMIMTTLVCRKVHSRLGKALSSRISFGVLAAVVQAT